MPKKTKSGYKTDFRGPDDARPESAKPAPGKIDRTSKGKTAHRGYTGENVSPFPNKDAGGGAAKAHWQGYEDSRPSSPGGYGNPHDKVKRGKKYETPSGHGVEYRG